MSIYANYDNLSDEGLDLLLRIILHRDDKLINDWDKIGKLIDSLKISITFINNELWSAEIDEENFGETTETGFGSCARLAIAQAIIRTHFPDGPAFRAPADDLGELFTSKFLLSETGKSQIQFALSELKERNKNDRKIAIYIS